VKVNYIVIHHSYSARDHTTLEDIRRWHLQMGWRDVGYHYVIEGSGRLRVGRSADQVGAHAAGFNYNRWTNTYSLGICLTGNFQQEVPSDAQKQNLVQLVAILCRRHQVPPERVVGHRDLNDTTCPGKHLYVFLPELRRRVAPYLVKGA